MSPSYLLLFALTISMVANSNAQTGANFSGKKICLLVGIDQYAEPASAGQRLHGCVNDVNAVAIALTSFGFPKPGEHGCCILRDQEATRRQIFASFADVIRRAEEGDMVYIHFSCHGSQEPDRNGDETDGDGHDETLIAYDTWSKKDGKEVPPILDDEIYHQLLKPLIQNGVQVVAVFDSCHSGDVQRDPFSQARWVDSKNKLAGTTSSNKTSMFGNELDAVIISACESGELARERKVSINGKDTVRGAFSHDWINALNSIASIPGQQTYRSVVESLPISCGGQKSRQNPTVQGLKKNVMVFDIQDKTPEPFVNAMHSGPGVAKLVGGEALGMTEGSIYALYESDANKFDGGRKRICEAEVYEVRALDALCRVRPSTLRIGLDKLPVAAYRAVELSHSYSAHKLTLRVPKKLKESQLGQGIANLIGESKFISIASDEAHATFGLKQSFELIDDTGRTLGGPYQEVSDFEEDLKKWCRFYQIRMLRNEPLESEATIRLDIVPATTIEGRRIGEFYSEEEVEFMIYLNSPNKMYVAILDLRENGEIELVYSSDNPLGGPVISLGKDNAETLEYGTLEKLNWLKVIASASKLPFQFMEQGPITTRTLDATPKNVQDPLFRLLLDEFSLESRWDPQVPRTKWMTHTLPTVIKREP